jgi:hypothetical protein
MRQAEIAAIIGQGTDAQCVSSLVEFFGIRPLIFRDLQHLAATVHNGALDSKGFAIIAPLPTIHPLKASAKIVNVASAVLAYASADCATSTTSLRSVARCEELEIKSVDEHQVQVAVSSLMPDFTGPLHGLTVRTKASRLNGVILPQDRTTSIIDVDQGSAFFRMSARNMFVTCCAEVPDLDQSVKGSFYDVKEHFLTVAPFVMFLKWAFRHVCWKPRESSACLIIDDPLIRPRYGFCNFKRIDQQMQEHSFATNIAFIPWNRRRTSQKTVNLVRSSGGRLSVSVHGCDHTSNEFGARDTSILNMKSDLAKKRMKELTARTGISHELVMVFPQGKFSRESMEVLQQHEFIAVVNTDIAPTNTPTEHPTLRECWDVALLRYSSLALFTRRYPWHGLENFAFDILLGKPCLVVEHHEFFKGDGREAIQFVSSLNALNCRLRWRGLPDVIERAYKWKDSDNGVVHVRMFANKLMLENDGIHERVYCVEKQSHYGNGAVEMWESGHRLEARSQGGVVAAEVKVAAKGRSSLQMLLNSPSTSHSVKQNVRVKAKVALRRYLSECRDNYVSRSSMLQRMLMTRKQI